MSSLDLKEFFENKNTRKVQFYGGGFQVHAWEKGGEGMNQFCASYTAKSSSLGVKVWDEGTNFGSIFGFFKQHFFERAVLHAMTVIRRHVSTDLGVTSKSCRIVILEAASRQICAFRGLENPKPVQD